MGLGIAFLGISFFLGIDDTKILKKKDPISTNENLESSAEPPFKSNPQPPPNNSSNDSPIEATAENPDQPMNLALSQLNSKKKEFVKCYNQALQKNPKLKGELKLEFSVLPSGKLESPQVKSTTIRDQSFFQCLQNTVVRIQLRPFLGDPFLMVLPLSFE